ncbi:MAG: hypothetical protein Q7O66_16730 [Dehalococcoidia bacterium]|nr:hypothetical protein [Dehalococcoidia bacterium]
MAKRPAPKAPAKRPAPVVDGGMMPGGKSPKGMGPGMMPGMMKRKKPIYKKGQSPSHMM